MLYSVTGELIHTEPGLAVISCGGVGFKCLTTLNTQRQLPKVGEKARLYTHLHVREDALDLFRGLPPCPRCTAFRCSRESAAWDPRSGWESYRSFRRSR